jgi:RNA polymerase sigma-70 factor (ECF subfamily)
MLAFRDGSDPALSDLYRRWAGPLLRYLERMVNERATAEELLQETFIRVHDARERYRPDARFSTWLFRIGRNLALNELDRARRRMPHLSASEDDARVPGESSLTLVSDAPSVETLVDARRRRSRVEAELAALPERQRSALWLAAVEGHSYREIAEVLDTSPQSVKALVHRARVTLAERMAESEGFAEEDRG